MIEEKYKAEVQAVWTVALDYQRGQTIPWSILETAMGRKREETGGWHIIRRLRRHLLRERDICTLPADTVGLRLLTDQQAARELPALRQRKARRQVNRCLREIQAVNLGSLSVHERRVLNAQRNNMQMERLQIGRSMREAKSQKTETLPVRKSPCPVTKS